MMPDYTIRRAAALSKLKRLRSEARFLREHLHNMHLWSGNEDPDMCPEEICRHLIFVVADLEDAVRTGEREFGPRRGLGEGA